jgi:hypothetical protein
MRNNSENELTGAEIAQKNSIEKSKNQIKLGIISALSVSLSSYLIYDNFLVPDKELTAKGFSAESIRLIQKISRQNRGLELVDPIKQSTDKTIISNFNTLSEHLYQAQNECRTTLEIKSDDTFIDTASIGRVFTQEIAPEIRKVGKVEFNNLSVFINNIKQLRVNCLQTVAFIPSRFNLNSIVLSGDLTDTLIADPVSPTRKGVDPDGFYVNITNQIFIRNFDSRLKQQGLFPHENQHRMMDVSLPKGRGNFEIQRSILGDILFDEWKNSGFEITKDIVSKIERLGLSEYSLYIEPSQELNYYRKIIREINLSEKKLEELKSQLSKSNVEKGSSELKKSITLVKESIVKLNSDLQLIIPKIIGPHEVDSTAMESHWDYLETQSVTKDKELMLSRFASLMSKYNPEIPIFDTKKREKWLSLVNVTKELCNQGKYEEAIKYIKESEFYKQNKN